MVFYIADTHFGDASVIGRCGRPFESADEMEWYMIETWNGKVGRNDTVYVIGDMFYRHASPERVLKQLNGRKRLIVGEHDAAWLRRSGCAGSFLSVDPYAEASDGKRKLVLCHYPLLAWNRQPKSFMLHGHIHNDVSGAYWPLIKNDPHLLNAGVDVNGFWPVTFEQLAINNACFKEGLELGEPRVVPTDE